MDSDGWMPKKRNSVSPTIQKTRAAKRAPSYIKTQVHDVGYKKLSCICARFVAALSDDTLLQSSVEFRAEMEPFVARTGEELLQRMLSTKKLAELVIFKINSVQNAVNAFNGCKDFSSACINVRAATLAFPDKLSARDYTLYKEIARGIAECVEYRAPARDPSGDQPTWVSDEEELRGRA